MLMSSSNCRRRAFAERAICGRLTAAAVLILLAADAHAQSIDYGSLERLFGEPVTTSATGSPQRASEVPANMVIITQADIRRSGADNIPDILQYVAGVDVRRYSLAQSEVAVRGYDQEYSPRLLVLINGRQVYLDFYGYTDWRSLPVQLREIRQIEVVKGPNSALFGFNALGGVINIVTYDPLFDPVDEVTASGGTEGYRAASAVATVRAADRAGLRLSAGAWQGDEFSTESLPPSTAGPYETSPHQFTAGADGRVEFNPRMELTAEANISDGTGIEDTPSPSLVTVDLRTASGKIGLTADTAAGLLTLVGYRNGASYSVVDTLRLQDDLDVVQASDLFKLSSAHTVRVGLEYRNEAVSGEGPHEVGDRILAASAMWNWRIVHDVAISNAVRVDRLSMTFNDAILPGMTITPEENDKGSVTTWSYNGGLVYTPTAVDTVRLLVARGAQAPSITDLGLQLQYPLGNQTLTFAGNPDLRPAVVVNYEMDYDRDVSALSSIVRTAVYYQDTRDLLASAINTPLTFTPEGAIAFGANVGSSRAAGGEVELKGHAATGLRWNASYARISITQHLTVDPLVGSSLLLDYADGTPANVVKAGFGYGAGRAEADLEGRWQSRFVDYASDAAGDVLPVTIGSYLTLSARVAYRLTPNVTLAISGQQLTHTRLLEAAGLPVERRVYGTITAKF
jgi:outer membrane receptor for ferrienterochelin and colicins